MTNTGKCFGIPLSERPNRSNANWDLIYQAVEFLQH